MATQWYPAGDYTIEEARSFLVDDYAKSLKRTRYLYTQAVQHPELGPGYFEPLTIALSACDFLGALYTGIGDGRNTHRATEFIDNILEQEFAGYRNASGRLIRVYRHGPVHAYAPAGAFDIRISAGTSHLTPNGNALVVGIRELLDHITSGSERLARELDASPNAQGPGSLVALNNARREIQAR